MHALLESRYCIPSTRFNTKPRPSFRLCGRGPAGRAPLRRAGLFAARPIRLALLPSGGRRCPPAQAAERVRDAGQMSRPVHGRIQVERLFKCPVKRMVKRPPGPGPAPVQVHGQTPGQMGRVRAGAMKRAVVCGRDDSDRCGMARSESAGEPKWSNG